MFSGKFNAAGITPTTVYGWPLRRIVWLMMFGLPANCRCQKPKLRTTLWPVPGSASSRVKPRPSIGETPSTSKNVVEDVTAPRSRAGSPVSGVTL